jgi:Cd2+/Zn2+-exporting ATPase
MEKTVQLDIPVLLPGVEDEQDQCVERLQEQIAARRGIEKAHIDRKNGQAFLCLHYDPELVSLAQVRRWAEEAGAAVTDRYRHETLHIRDMDCADCAVSIEHILGRVDGVLDVSVNYAAEKMRVEFDSTVLQLQDVVRRVEALGFTVEEEERPESWVRRNWELVFALLSGFFLALAFFGEAFFSLPRPVAIAFYVMAYITGGYDASRHGVRAALHLRFDIDFLMVVAAVGAAVLGEWAEGALLLFLFSLGHSLEHFATGKARRAIRALADIAPRSARVRRDGREVELPVEELQRGDVVIVRAGERIPIDGKVVEGHSAVDQSPITGESVPVEKEVGEDVYAGTVNGEGALVIEVTRLAKDTTLARVVQMVEEAQTQKSPTQRFTERFERVFVPVVLVGVGLVLLLPPLFGWLSFAESFLRAMTILVAASPCALGIATPSAVLSGVAQAARNGVLLKGGMHLENLGRVDAMAFDKTGTITRGQPEVTDLVPLDEANEVELLRLAAAAESRSQHPLARAIVRLAEERGLELPGVGDVQAVVGRGLRAEVDGQVVAIGNLKLFEEPASGEVPDSVGSRVAELENAGKTTMVVQADGRFLGIIALADRPRHEANSTLARLRNLGIRRLIMITGDNERVAAAIAREVGIDEYRANLLPEDKVEAVKLLLKDYGEVAMVGDGVNDAPAMAVATVGIAMGSAGSDVALESADVALMADDLSKLPFAVALSRESRRIIRQNLVASLGVIALLIPAALFGLASIGIAIVFHEGSTLVVVANALRLLGFRESKAG